MTTIDYIKSVFPVALSLLPAKMDTPEARAMVLAIFMQESRLEHRVQIGGPAHGFGQFEFGGGIRGVLNHPASQSHIQSVLSVLRYDFHPQTSYDAIVHNDVLAVCYARLLLWTLPQSLPKQGEIQEGWNQYIAAWRPGRPHRETWDAFYIAAWT